MAEQTKAASREWNYHPEFPIDNNPLFSWPDPLERCGGLLP